MELFYDVGSPYAYLAVERFESVVGEPPELRPVLLGGIFKATGRSTWGRGAERGSRMADIEARAAAAGLPPVVWPDGWPGDYLQAMRTVVWAGDDFGRVAMRAAFAEGADLSRLDVLAELARCLGLEGLEDAVADDAVKAALRAATDRAVALGVTGVPTMRAGDELFWGDDRLEDVARRRRVSA
jgi:2-hydroxychromene-2-carboxylate isomerase